MPRGRKPLARRTAAGSPLNACPRCPDHLSAAARREWRRLSTPLHAAGVLTVADRAALAAYCQAWARWVEAEEQLRKTPPLLKTPSGYVQQSPWLAVANKQLELMARFMAELGLSPAARARLGLPDPQHDEVTRIEVVMISTGPDGRQIEEPLHRPGLAPPAQRIGE
ncbi:MAG: phage terminase small subunit P27 family [Paracoccaceae bacterium]